MKKIWIVYRPQQGYDDGIENLLASPSEVGARRAAERINDFMYRLRERIARIADPFEDGISDEEHTDRWDRRQELIARARWPFGVCLEYDIGESVDVAAVMPVKEVV